MKYFSLLLLTALITTSCASRLPMPAGIPEVTPSQFEDISARKTKKVEIYEGLMNKMTVSATWLDSELSDLTLAHSARIAQWPESKYKEERFKVVNRHTDKTEFFVSFFTPEKKTSDLANTKNLWKIYMDVNGQRYEGKATKVKMMLSEVQAMYPSHNRWSYPFIVTFPVGTAMVENKPAVLTFTGAVGSAQITFP